MKPLLACAAMLFTFPLSLRAATPKPPAISFGADAVTVTDITPGADVYLFSVSREAQGYFNRIVPREIILHDTAKSGQAQYTLGHAVPFRSIWFAVDLKTGRPIVASPPGYASHPITLDEHLLKKDGNGDVTLLAFEGTLVDIIVVRPGQGVWGATVGLHGAKDESLQDARAENRFAAISPLRLEPRAGTTAAPPAKLLSGDVVFLMNSYSGQYAYAVLGDTQ